MFLIKVYGLLEKEMKGIGKELATWELDRGEVTLERNKNRTRCKKSAGARRKRHRDQKKRLVALGMDEAVVAKMTSREVLTRLKRPAKVAKECAASSE